MTLESKNSVSPYMFCCSGRERQSNYSIFVFIRVDSKYEHVLVENKLLEAIYMSRMYTFIFTF